MTISGGSKKKKGTLTLSLGLPPLVPIWASPISRKNPPYCCIVRQIAHSKLYGYKLLHELKFIFISKHCFVASW